MHIQDWKADIDRKIWGPHLEELPAPRRWLLTAVRIVSALMRDWWEGNIALRATSLVYTTLLSLVPLLALAFSVVKAFGANNILGPLLMQALAPLGDSGIEVANRILQFVQRMQVGVLGSLGLVFLLYTAFSLIGQVEQALNFIWRVDRLRPLAQRFNQYMSVLLIGPVFMVSAFGISASIASSSVVHELLQVQVLGTAAYAFGRVIPYLLVVTALTFIYAFVPYTRVRLSAALVGGIVGGLMWEVVGWVFASLVVTSTRYAAIYSSFAILVMFLIWVYLSWLVMLLGASVSFYVQHPEYLQLNARTVKLSARVKERLALFILYLVGRHHEQGLRPWCAAELAARLNMPAEAVATVIEELEQSGVLLASGDDPPRYVPARAIDSISLADALEQVRSAGEQEGVGPEAFPSIPELDAVLERVGQAVEAAVERRSLRELMKP